MEIVPQIVIVRKMNVYLKRQTQVLPNLVTSYQSNNVKDIEIVIEVISAEMANVKAPARKI